MGGRTRGVERTALALALAIASVAAGIVRNRDGMGGIAGLPRPEERGGSAAASPSTGQEPRVFLRFASDSAVVGHYKLVMRESSRLAFDIAADDPRRELLRAATAPKTTDVEIAATIVSIPRDEEEDRRYTLYWLGFRHTGDDVRSLSPIQWDSIFRQVGRRAVLNLTARGRPLGVQVSSDAARPVAEALARSLSALALTLPVDSAGVGASWQSDVAVPVRGLDGSRTLIPVRVKHYLRALEDEPDGLRARIEFDGEPVAPDSQIVEVSGAYFGESVFAVGPGRYERVMALANLEISWPMDESGLPPSRSIVEWRAELNRH